ncbi:MAG: hypothetical protein WD114_00380 [Phycisphaerales bacterium]
MGLLVALVALTTPAPAQPTIPAGQAIETFNRVQQWVRDWDMPARDDSSAATAPVSAAVVTLRLDGRVFGRGAAATPDPSPMLVWEAAGEAFNSAAGKLTTERDATWESSLEQLGGRITISLEIADELIPISANELAMPGFGYSPGAMGVAVRRGDRTEAIGAGSMLMRETDMARSAMALANSLAGGTDTMLRSPVELAEAGFAFYRFEPVVLAQPAPGLGAAFVDRGGRVIETSEISVRSLETLADRIAGHLIGRRWSGVERYGFTGTLDPVTGRTESNWASPFEQAISAYALLRYGQPMETAAHRHAFQTGRQVLRDLAAVEEGEAMPWEDPLGASMAVIALSQLQLVNILADDELNTLRLNALETLDRLYSDDDGFAEGVPDAAGGLIAHALASSARLDPRDRTGLARSAVRAVFLETPQTALVTQMPFLGWAELELAGEEEVPASSALQAMRELVWEHQLRRSDLSWSDRDLSGGIVFTGARAPLPSWVSMRPLAFIASMLGDERLTPGSAASGEVPAEIGRMIDSLRFVRQLVAEGEIMHLYSAHDRAHWGVRMALWDQRMPVEVDAMALLVLTETLESIERISARSSP